MQAQNYKTLPNLTFSLEYLPFWGYNLFNVLVKNNFANLYVKNYVKLIRQVCVIYYKLNKNENS